MNNIPNGWRVLRIGKRIQNGDKIIDKKHFKSNESETSKILDNKNIDNWLDCAKFLWTSYLGGVIKSPGLWDQVIIIRKITRIKFDSNQKPNWK